MTLTPNRQMDGRTVAPYKAFFIRDHRWPVPISHDFRFLYQSNKTEKGGKDLGRTVGQNSVPRHRKTGTFLRFFYPF